MCRISLSGLLALSSLPVIQIRVFQWQIAKPIRFILFQPKSLNGNQDEKSEEDDERDQGINFNMNNILKCFSKHDLLLYGFI